MNPEREQHVGACVVVVDDKQRILLGKRLNSYKAGYYGIPGGRVNVGELLEQCAQRELYEETMIKSNKLKYLGTIRENERAYDFIHFAYACLGFMGEVTLTEPDKCEGWGWYGLDELPEPLLPGHAAAIELYKHSLAGENAYLVDITP